MVKALMRIARVANTFPSCAGVTVYAVGANTKRSVTHAEGDRLARDYRETSPHYQLLRHTVRKKALAGCTVRKTAFAENAVRKIALAEDAVRKTTFAEHAVTHDYTRRVHKSVLI
ncbi:hypothetical protein LSAT2_030123 [Lamellibrachia satsuma]|nr:hypothetical protein LSAT2_030123 [Lamellibrachia satsuma]